MNREEKEVVVAFVIAIVALAVMCILSLQTCVTGFVIVATASLWAYAWTLFGRLLREAAERQNTEHSG
jgi:ABC-type bacteriocin/lantibiotic exporter with double-glycine peptidase domain